MSDPIERLCVVIGRARHKMVQAEIQEAAKRGARFVELRLDFLTKAPDLKRLLADKPCELMATIRRPADGGRFGGTEDERKMLLRQCVVSGFDWVDLETDVADEIRRFGKVRRVVSYHNMKETPADLEQVYARMCGQDADVVKLAVTAQKPADNVRVLQLLKDAKRPTVAHCMGEIGFPSRFLGLKFGAAFAYAAFNKERGIAPGMPSFDEARHVYHADRVTPATQVFGLLGDPVAHSHSPVLHNTLFRKLGVDAVYLPFRVPPGELKDYLDVYQQVPVTGYSVTIPHKETAALLAQHRDDLVVQTGSANTLLFAPALGVVVNAEGFRAYNTDYPAVTETLDALWKRDGVAGTRQALVLGAGGVARTVAHALKQLGVLVTVSNRTSERADRLAAEVDGKFVDWVARHNVANCDLLVNCTPVGMHPHVDESPVHASFLRPGLTVFDTVYTPETTLLIKDARSRGCQTITGVELFVRQAAGQFKLFTNRDAPLPLMAQTLRRAISPVVARPADDEE